MRKLYTYLLGLVVGILFFSIQSEAQSLPENKGAQMTKESITLSLYPNPSNGEFRIEMDLESKVELRVKLFDLTGKLVEDLSGELSSESGKVTADIKLKDTNPGIYFLRVESGKRSGTKKIVIR